MLWKQLFTYVAESSTVNSLESEPQDGAEWELLGRHSELARCYGIGIDKSLLLGMELFGEDATGILLCVQPSSNNSCKYFHYAETALNVRVLLHVLMLHVWVSHATIRKYTYLPGFMTACLFISLRVESLNGSSPSWLIVFKLFSYCDCALCCTMKTWLVTFATCLKLIISTFGREMTNLQNARMQAMMWGLLMNAWSPTQSAATSSSTHISLQDNQMWVCWGWSLFLPGAYSQVIEPWFRYPMVPAFWDADAFFHEVTPFMITFLFQYIGKN